MSSNFRDPYPPFLNQKFDPDPVWYTGTAVLPRSQEMVK